MDVVPSSFVPIFRLYVLALLHVGSITGVVRQLRHSGNPSRHVTLTTLHLHPMRIRQCHPVRLLVLHELPK